MSGNLYCVHDLLNAIGRERLDNDSVILCVFFRFLREFLRNFEWRPKKAIVQGLLQCCCFFGRRGQCSMMLGSLS